MQRFSCLFVVILLGLGVASCSNPQKKEEDKVTQRSSASSDKALEQGKGDAGLASCICPKDFRPVCDPKTKRTYSNACQARCEGVTEVEEGPCP